jgi:TonB family protein
VNISRFAPKGFNRSFSSRPLYVAGLSLALFSSCFLQASAAQEATRKVIARTAPTYPELAKRMHVAGKVKLEVVVTASGVVKSVALVGGSPVFERSAVDAVKQWRFEPAQTETKAIIALEFSDQ